MWEVRWIFHQIELPIENEISNEISCTPTRTWKKHRNLNRNESLPDSNVQNSTNDMTSPHHIILRPHVILAYLSSTCLIILFEIISADITTHLLPSNVMSFHYIDVFWLHLIWNDLTSPPFSSYVIPFHCKASYITAFHLVSSCLIWKNVSWCSSQAQRNTLISWPYVLLLLWSFEATNFEF